ncbi:hypothetical protein P280DRAFT_472791 [Massarina eburnea CBS 473.64]|uniref:MOSC domain-containing protein n=1 Tax=Massarina eburnea CBS 473.64 TaxID=1395130 RepID=A0A6A6RP11_9PLEO|nr:hypothetical protein P280DRAFT_472791 [Massarina eburnea CBS 473.64]
MASNILDDVLTSAWKIWETTTPLTLSITLVALLLPPISAFLLALSHRPVPIPPPPGCRKLGLLGRSNLHDQFSKKYSSGADPSPSNPWTVKALFIYPIKSCARLELDSADVIRTGLRYDRQFALAQQSTGLPNLKGEVKSEWTFITQRTFPRLAKVETEIWIPDPSAPDYDEQSEWVKSQGCMVVRFPFTPDTEFSVQGLRNIGQILGAKLQGNSEPMMEFRVPFNPDQERISSKSYRREEMKIWSNLPVAMNMGSEVPIEAMAKLRYTLGVTNPLTLFRIDTEKYREVFKCAPKKEDVGFQPIIGMQDSYPMHIQNLASIHHITSNLPRNSPLAPLSALRYRPNIIITGPSPFAEDSWTRARIGSLKYHISCRTTRCKLPNVDPETGILDKNEPGSTMRKYRVIDGGSQSSCLGMQVCPLEEGVVKIGDSVEVLETGEHFFLKE